MIIEAAKGTTGGDGWGAEGRGADNGEAESGGTVSGEAVGGEADSGHRTVPHTADARIEAWAPTRERCIVEAVRGAVESFADTSACTETSMRECHISGERDEDLLVAVLDEVVYRLDTAGEIPVGLDVDPADSGVQVRFVMADVECVRPVGAVPKAVSLHELRLARGGAGWTCSVTLDV
jgi:SHS2 domain-containing protein